MAFECASSFVRSGKWWVWGNLLGEKNREVFLVCVAEAPSKEAGNKRSFLMELPFLDVGLMQADLAQPSSEVGLVSFALMYIVERSSQKISKHVGSQQSLFGVQQIGRAGLSLVRQTMQRMQTYWRRPHNYGLRLDFHEA